SSEPCRKASSAGRCGTAASTSTRCSGRCSRKIGATIGCRQGPGCIDEAPAASSPCVRRRRCRPRHGAVLRRSSPHSFRPAAALRGAARALVVAVVALGTVLFFAGLPHIHFGQPLLFAALLVLSSLSASLKVSLPLTASGSTMSVSYAVDFASLLLLGPHETMLIAAGSAVCQSNFNSKDRNPPHRILFNIASLVITVQAAGLAFNVFGAGDAAATLSGMARPLVAAATVYFLFNTGLVAA